MSVGDRESPVITPRVTRVRHGPRRRGRACNL
jgi:hypothetical protein